MGIKYDQIGREYNATRSADPYITGRLLYHLQPEQGRLYLDIGCGTGNYTIALAEKGLSFVGVEPSDRMLGAARSRKGDINWVQGTAEQIPAGDNVFDGIVATLTIHHWTDLKKAFAEVGRVLSGNGRLVLFTSTPEQMEGYWLNHYFPRMLRASMAQMPSLADIREAMGPAELEIRDIEQYFVKDDLQDCFLYVGKNNPRLYFDETIRQGISSFSSLASPREVEQGLLQLRSDIDNHRFDRVRKHYENESGDYLFLVISKKGSI